jgi:poly(3-hydroxybutyrate) depolymerase
MKRPISKWMLSPALAAAALAMLATPPLGAEVIEKMTKAGGARVQYKVVLPDGYDPAETYPGILAFGGGPETMETVDGLLERNLRAEAEKRGYIVVAPAAPAAGLFFQGGERIFPEFLDQMLAEYHIEDGKFHVVGPSNGGIAAMHVAAAHSRYFRSVTAFPGYLWQPTDAKLDALAGICVFMYVGEMDRYRWHDEMKREAAYLRANGTLARYTVEAGQPHRLATLAGEHAGRLFDGFEQARKGCSR